MPAKMEKTRHPGIFKRGGRYVVVYRHRGKQHKPTFRNVSEALQAQAQFKADISRGELRHASRASFGEYAREWIDTYSGRTTRGFRESTRIGYRRTLEDKAIPFFEGRTARLAEIEPRDVRQFIAWLFDEKEQGRRLALSTVRSHVAAVRALFATAVEDGAIRYSPVTGVRISRPGVALDKDTAKERRALEKEELARWLEACEPEWRTMFTLLAHTGLRIGEAIELRWGDVDLGAKRLRVRRQMYRGTINAPKSKYGKRDVPLSTGMARTLWGLQRGPEDLLFADEFGRQLTYHWFDHRVIKPTRKASGLPWVTCHTFRHTAASLLFASGKNIKQVQEWLGHSDPGFTMRTYVHLMDDGLGDADFMDDISGASVSDRAAGESADVAALAAG